MKAAAATCAHLPSLVSKSKIWISLARNEFWALAGKAVSQWKIIVKHVTSNKNCCLYYKFVVDIQVSEKGWHPLMLVSIWAYAEKYFCALRFYFQKDIFLPTKFILTIYAIRVWHCGSKYNPILQIPIKISVRMIKIDIFFYRPNPNLNRDAS